jgi:hypothetical protein
MGNVKNCDKKTKTPWSESASELYRPGDRRLSAKQLPTCADRGCHVVSVTDPSGHSKIVIVILIYHCHTFITFFLFLGTTINSGVLKRSEREADHLPSSSVEVKKK